MRLLRPHLRRPHHQAPFLRFTRNERSELLRAAARHFIALRNDFFAHVGILQGAVERLVETRNNRRRRPFWYDQPLAEWVVVLAGSAGLRFEGEAEVKVLSEGDYILIPARIKHRVEWTSKDHATIWLAVHYPETE